MSRDLKTTEMGERHEETVNTLFGFRASPGSGNQWRSPLDGRHTGNGYYRFGHDAKSTLGKSIGVSRAMWAKLLDQAHDLRPMLPLRFYATESLSRVQYDLAVVDLHDLQAMWSDAEAYRDLCR